jgi:hypothetical protein
VQAKKAAKERKVAQELEAKAKKQQELKAWKENKEKEKKVQMN